MLPAPLKDEDKGFVFGGDHFLVIWMLPTNHLLLSSLSMVRRLSIKLS